MRNAKKIDSTFKLEVALLKAEIKAQRELSRSWQERFEKLSERFERSEARIAKLEAENQALRLENKALKIENGKLREKLGLNSSNSSIPSSREMYKLERNKEKSGRGIGGQVGHEGITRKRIAPTEVIRINLPDMCECGGKICKSKVPYIKQKIDLPKIEPIVQEYQLEHGRCNRCGARKSAVLPEDVTNDVFGPRVKAVAAALTGFYKNSKSEVSKIFKDVFNLDISISSISNNEAKVAEKCEKTYQEVEQEASRSKILHIDETSHYKKGKIGWAWIFASKTASFLKLTDFRNKKVLENSGFDRNNNIIVTDRYAVYNYFSEKNRQICWAHLARDFKRFEHSWNLEVKIIGCYLSQVAKELFALKKALLNEQIDVLRFLRRAKKLKKRTCRYLKEIYWVPDATQASKVAKNLLRSERMMWKFLDDPVNIPLTNNHAEQQLRHYVIYRKNSYFTQSDRGNAFLERVISLYLTWKQNGKNPFQNLLSLVI